MKWDEIRKKIKATDKKVLTAVVQAVDGHTIYAPKKFIELGLDEAVVKAFTKKINSGLSPKEQIYVNGVIVPALVGVYGLDLLEFIASTFGVSSWKLGRGSRAGHLTEQLVELYQGV